MIGVIHNPRARKNRAVSLERIDRLRAIVGPHGVVIRTQSLDALPEAIERLLPSCRYLVCDGGDGALHHVINEVRRAGGESSQWPTFVPTNGGTIDFVARKVGVAGRAEAIVSALTDAVVARRFPPDIPLDTLWLSGRDDEDRPFDRVGFALAAGGIGQRFFDEYYSKPDPDALTIVKVISDTVVGFALSRLRGGRGAPTTNGRPGVDRTSLRYRPGDSVPPRPEDRSRVSAAQRMFEPCVAEVRIDGEKVPHHEHGGIHAGAFDINLGGVVRVFPLARARGVLHFQAGGITPTEIILNLPNIVRGTAIRSPRVVDTAGREMTIDAEGRQPLNPIVDGERFLGLRSLCVRLGPEVRIAQVGAPPLAG